MRRFTALAAALLSIFPSVAQAAEPPCLSPGEFASLAEYALPSAITGASQRCSSQLPVSAYLRREGPALAQRYAQRRPGAWPGAKAAFLKLSATTNTDANNVIRTLPDQALQQMLASLLEGMVVQQVPLERCTTIDRMFNLLSPLPAQSTAELIVIGIGLFSKTGKTKIGVITVCQG